MSDFNDFLSQMKYRPERFSNDGYRLTHIESGVTVWIANGYFFYEIEKPRIKLSLWEKFKFLMAMRRYKKTMLDMLLEVKNER